MHTRTYSILAVFCLTACGGAGAGSDQGTAGSTGTSDGSADGGDGDGGHDGGTPSCGDDVSAPGACVASEALIPVAGAPWGIGAGDVDGDGNPDLVVGHSVEMQLSVLRGIGGGGFEQPVVVDVEERLYRVLVADFDADGYDDILTWDSANSSEFLLFFGDAALSLDRRTSFTLSVNEHVEARDVVGDGALDLIAGDFGSVVVLEGDGAGGFAEVSSLDVPGGSVFALGDLDRDGILDAVTGSGEVESIGVARGSADGSFGPLETQGIGVWPGRMRVGDFDCDELPDVVMQGSETPPGGDEGGEGGDEPPSPRAGGFLCMSAGDGTGQLDEAVSLGAGGGGNQQLFVGDLDQNGAPDVVQATGSDITVLLNDGAGAFTSLQVGSQSASGFTVADLNGDGILDIATTNSQDDTVNLILLERDCS